jgi:hypothetical protein
MSAQAATSAGSVAYQNPAITSTRSVVLATAPDSAGNLD